MEGETQDEPVKDLDELENADWVRIIFTFYTILPVTHDHVLGST